MQATKKEKTCLLNICNLSSANVMTTINNWPCPWRNTVVAAFLSQPKSCLPIHHCRFFCRCCRCRCCCVRVFDPVQNILHVIITILAPPLFDKLFVSCWRTSERAHTHPPARAAAIGATNWTSMMQHFSSFAFISPFSFRAQFLPLILSMLVHNFIYRFFPPFFTYNFYSLYFHVFFRSAFSTPTHTHTHLIHLNERAHAMPETTYTIVCIECHQKRSCCQRGVGNKWYVNAMFIT